MRSSSAKDYSVYEFNKEDEAVESSARLLTKKFGRRRSLPVTKNTFLQTFVQGSDGDCKSRNDSGTYAVGASKRDSTVQREVSEVDDIVVCTSGKSDQHGHFDEDNSKTGDLLRMQSPEMGSPRVTSMCNKQLNCLWVELASDDKPVDVISDDDESLKGRSLSTPVSHPTEDEGALGHSSTDYCISGYKDMEKKVSTEVVVSPEFVLYGDSVFAQSQLTFSSDLVKLEVFGACESDVSFSFEWAVDDIIYIECRRSENVDITYVKLRRRPTAVKGVENLNGSSAISKLLLAVSDPNWQETEEMITSLAASYKSMWNPIPTEMADEDDDFMGRNIMFSLKRYLSNFDEPFEDVVYPEGDPDAVCISIRDVELLQPATFINDTIIDFYIKYLKNKIQLKDKDRFHFFNSFFFRKLADLDKDPGRASQGRAAFLRVRKWTRKVNIFEKDYIFIPINFNLHWSLIVVCHPGEISYFKGKDEEIRNASKVPCILHMDSIKGSHRGLKNLFQSYLWEEWKERHEESSEAVSLRFSNLRFISLELPQQENSFDCGLFLLHYVELFLEGAPVNFNPFKITTFSNFLSPNWFPPAEASHKRSAIHKLIYEIIEKQSLNALPASCSNQNNSKFPESDMVKEVGEFLPERHGSTKKSCLANPLSTIFYREVEIKLSAPSSPGGVEYGKEMGTVSSEFYEHENVARSYLDEQDPPSDQIAIFEKLSISTLQEDVETYDQSDKAGCRLSDGIMTKICTTSYSLKDVGVFEIESQEILTSSMEHRSGDSPSRFSSCESTNSSEVGFGESRDLVSSNKQLATETPRSASPENCRDGLESTSFALSGDPDKCLVKGSCKRKLEVETVGESKESGESFFSCTENLPPASRQDAESAENCDTSSDDVHVISDCSEARSKQLPRKRKKFMPLIGERRCTRSMARAWYS